MGLLNRLGLSALIGTAVYSTGCCSLNSHLSLEEQARFERLVGETNALFTQKAREEILDSKARIGNLEGSSMVKSRLLAGKYNPINKTIKLDADFFRESEDVLIKRVIVHEYFHHLLAHSDLIDENEFTAEYERFDKPMKDWISGMLELYNLPKIDETEESISLAGEYSAYLIMNGLESESFDKIFEKAD